MASRRRSDSPCTREAAGALLTGAPGGPPPSRGEKHEAGRGKRAGKGAIVGDGGVVERGRIAFDKNGGASFWWANSLNSFTGNVAAECDEFGYRFDMVESAGFQPVLPVRQPDTSTLPFIQAVEDLVKS
jgi:hypothetical protein